MKRKSGLADSPFFTPLSSLEGEPSEHSKYTVFSRAAQAPISQEQISPEHDTTIPRYRDTMTPQNHDTVIPRYHDTTIEYLRKAVKDFGKEAATHRFTIAEKRAIADIL